MKKQILSEQFQRMQKLAGIITESPLTVGSAGIGTGSSSSTKENEFSGEILDTIKQKNLQRGDKVQWMYSFAGWRDKTPIKYTGTFNRWELIMDGGMIKPFNLSNVKSAYGIVAVINPDQSPSKLSRFMYKFNGEDVEDRMEVETLEKQKLTEGFLGDVVKKLKKLFTGEKMEKVRDSDGYSYFKDEDGKEWIGVTRMDLRYEPGYQKSWVAIYDLKDESKIKQATSNAKAQNKKYMNVQDDPFSGGVVASTTMVGDYYPEPVKVINSKTF